MIYNILFLTLVGGIPYYLILEKIPAIKSKHIFLLSAFLLLSTIILSAYVPNEHKTSLVIVSLVSSLFTIYKATKTTNFYKLAYYFLFVNAPFFVLYEGESALYSLSLLLSLLGLYWIGRFYERNYGSANYRYITGITLVRPYIGTYLTFYLIAIALYPPFPNSLFFLKYILGSESNLLWFGVVITLFFGNFFLAMNVMKKTLFGRPNSHIHYVHMTAREKMPHILIIGMLLLFSVFGLKEILL
ncbi:hypothetical protein JHD49_06160 [Sulfurimonas sp. SAG-AH-194-C21]|nr:hypothetical protein [Sulfurimonas sp. SAG-AH-194-C21]MDF1883520.1 hypothetical protein [Sulfurimonas sp. SAG-AH-194-C21]